MKAQTLTRSNRFSYDPRPDKDGVIADVFITPGDVRRFEAMAPYDYLTADYIAALTGGDEKSITHRFGNIKVEPHRWIDNAAPMVESKYAMKLYKNDFLAYSLNAKSKALLKSKGKEIHSYGCNGPFVHKLMASWVRASFDIGIDIEKLPAEIIPFHAIKASPNTPVRTREDSAAHAITVAFRYRGDNQPRKVFADCYPFALKTDGYALLFLEIDGDTEAIRGDLDLKLLRWISILEQGLHRERYAFTKAYVLLVTTSEPHMQNIMARLIELTAHRPSLRKYFLFKRHPSLKSDDRPRPTGHMLTEDWQRAGTEPFNLLK